MATTTLFVYGTLRRGQRNHRYLFGQEFLAEARTVPHYRLHDCGGYPGLVEDRSHDLAVSGEVWSVDDEALRAIDLLEEAPILFSRRQVVLEQFPPPVWAYFYQGDATAGQDCGGRWPPLA
jgi:gamma-glutamylaminecyclotransferase